MSEDKDRITTIILTRLERIETKLDMMQANGCSKADGHDMMRSDTNELFRRVNAIEKAQAEGRGKIAIIVAVISTASGLFFAWIGKQIS